MEKLQMQSANGVSMNIEKIAALFPSCVTETTGKDGRPCMGIDFEKLKEELCDDIIDKGKERYQFTWPDKRKAIHLANTPTDKTLRPCREESVDFDHTQNLYIEGDNLDVLKLLRDNYLGGVKMIYIDPPYNTGNDFVYNDNFTMESDLFSEASGEKDEVGNRMVVNSDSNGRFHTDWLNMMYPRLKVARDLLTEDGVIFISIDDNEVSNLTSVCDELFGERNRISLICHKSRASVSNDKIISPNHNIILFYCKNIDIMETKRKFIGLDPILENFNYNDNDGKGEYRLVPVDGPGGEKKGNPHYEILGITGYWRFSKETMMEKIKEGLVVQRKNSLYQKYYKTTAETTRRTATTWWNDGGLTSTATSKLKELMGTSSFDTPKPVELLNRMLQLTTYYDKDSIILDFFSGSSTTAQAVMEMNINNAGGRKFIMVQIPEKCNEKSEAFKAGYSTICEIGKERIRRAAAKIKSEMEAEGKDTSKMDFGFRVLKLDSSNMKDVYYTPQETSLDTLFTDNVKEDRTAEDLLFQVMPKCDLMLSEKIVKENIKGKDVYFVKDNYLAACFDKDLTDDVITEIAKRQPFHFVMMEGGAAQDSVLDNFEQLFRTYSPGTKCMVI